MARLEDYLPKDDEIQQEIDQAVTKTEERQDQTTIPERFSGKSAEEIANSYTELEKLNSRQAQDLGEMRKQVDLLMRQSLEQAQAKPPEEETAPVTVDDLYENPEEAIAKVLEKKIKPQLEEQRNLLAQQSADKQLSTMDSNYEGWREKVTTPEFQQWIDQSGYRQRMAERVRAGDLDAASDLVEQYYDTNVQQAQQQKEQQRQQDLNNASLTKGGAEYTEPVKTFSRTELMNVRIRAKQGDRAADAWLRNNSAQIELAYSEGRVVD